MMKDNLKRTFVNGAVSPEFIAWVIQNQQSKTSLGAHSIFLGQVRADQKEGGIVSGILYSAFEDMAEQKFSEIRENAFTRFELSCVHIYHSLDLVRVGQICLFVMVSSAHRQSAFEASSFIVEQIKANVPIFGKELFGNDSEYSWKENH